MIHSVFSVHDAKADAFLPPFILPKTEMAQRVFSDCVNSPDHQFGKHPEDYTLFHLGTFDDENGLHTPHRNTKQSLGNGVEYLDFSHQMTDPDHAEATTISNEAPILASSKSGNSS